MKEKFIGTGYSGEIVKPSEFSAEAHEFLDKFRFDPQKRLWVGVEEERLITKNGISVPEAKNVLSGLSPSFTYELSAHQIEIRTMPISSVEECCFELLRKRNILQHKLASMGLSSKAIPAAPADIPLDIFPDPRYQNEVVPKLSEERLRAACRIMGTHIHVGLGSFGEALRVYNALVGQLGRLVRLSGQGNLERLRLYEVVVQGKQIPDQYKNIKEFVHAAKLGERGGREIYRDPKDDWGLVRISRHGTVEVRLFPATEDLLQIRRWISAVKTLAAGSIQHR